MQRLLLTFEDRLHQDNGLLYEALCCGGTKIHRTICTSIRLLYSSQTDLFIKAIKTILSYL